MFSLPFSTTLFIAPNRKIRNLYRNGDTCKLG